MDETIIWNIIDKYFKNNTNVLVEHHLESYNDFFKTDIFRIFREKNPVRLVSNYDESIDDYRNQCLMYFGGKNADKIYFGKPVIYDDNDNVHYMFPNEARLRNMTYGITIHYDIEVEFIDILKPGEEPTSLLETQPVELHNEGENDYVIDKPFENVKHATGKEDENNDETAAVHGGARPSRRDRTRRNKKPYALTTSMTADLRRAPTACSSCTATSRRRTASTSPLARS